jgi:hypothetical protein
MDVNEDIITRINFAIVNAKRNAQFGDAGSMEASLSIAEEAAEKTGSDISHLVSNIRHEGYRCAAEYQLYKAVNFAVSGNTFAMEPVLETAKKYASIAGIDISEKVGSIEVACYSNALPSVIARAKRFAESGDKRNMHIFLTVAHRYAERVGDEKTLEIIGRVRQLFG